MEFSVYANFCRVYGLNLSIYRCVFLKMENEKNVFRNNHCFKRFHFISFQMKTSVQDWFVINYCS